ncbi:MAG: helix-turn-helix domain-containing protein [Myxococcota bacterium]
MPSEQADLILHPVRLRLILALSSREATTSELSSLLPDVPRATLHRHLGRLVEGGLIEVTQERRGRGRPEKTYGVPVGADVIAPDEAAQLTSEDLERHFATFTATLMQGLSSGLARTGPVGRVHFQARELTLDHDGETRILERLSGALTSEEEPACPEPPGERFLMAFALFPTG